MFYEYAYYIDGSKIFSNLDVLFKDDSLKVAYCLIGVASIIKLIKNDVHDNVSRNTVMALFRRFSYFQGHKNNV